MHNDRQGALADAQRETTHKEEMQVAGNAPVLETPQGSSILRSSPKLIDQPSPMTALERSASQGRQLLGTSAYSPAISRAAYSPASTKVVEAVESPAATNTSVVLNSTSSSSSSYPNLQSSNLKTPVPLVDPDAQLTYSVEELNVGLDVQEQTSHADTTDSGKSSNRQARKGGRKSNISRYTAPRTPSKDGPKTIKRRPSAGGRSPAGLAP